MAEAFASGKTVVYVGPPFRSGGREVLPGAVGSLVEKTGDGVWTVRITGCGRSKIDVEHLTSDPDRIEQAVQAERVQKQVDAAQETVEVEQFASKLQLLEERWSRGDLKFIVGQYEGARERADSCWLNLKADGTCRVLYSRHPSQGGSASLFEGTFSVEGLDIVVDWALADQSPRQSPPQRFTFKVPRLNEEIMYSFKANKKGVRLSLEMDDSSSRLVVWNKRDSVLKGRFIDLNSLDTRLLQVSVESADGDTLLIVLTSLAGDEVKQMRLPAESSTLDDLLQDEELRCDQTELIFPNLSVSSALANSTLLRDLQ